MLASMNLIKYILLYLSSNTRTEKMGRISPYLLVFVTAVLLSPVGCVHSTQPIIVSPNTESSPSNFIFSFTLANQLPTSAYLLVTFSPFTTDAIPFSCDMLDQATATVSLCTNLNTPSQAITISQGNINNINTNVNASRTVVLQFSQTLSSSTQYRIQIITENVLPNIGSITSSLEMYTVTDTGMIIEENWNFGQVFLEERQNQVLSVLSRNTMTTNSPGTTFTNLLFDIDIGVPAPTNLSSRLKFVISDGFTWTDSSLVNTQPLVGAAPQILESVIVSPNVIVTTFNQSFVVDREFSVTIADYLNPLEIASGFISVYHLPYNSLSPLEMLEESIPISTIAFVPTLNLLTIDGTTPTQPIQFYTDTIQYIKLTILVPRDIETNFIFKIQTDTLIIHEGSVHAKASTVEASSLSYNHVSSSIVEISGFPRIPESSLVTVTMRVEVPSNPLFNFYVSIDKADQLSSPIIYNSITSSSAVIPTTFVSAFTGSEGEDNKLSWMQNTDSSISFTVTPTFTTNAGSSLRIITSNKLVSSVSFDGSSSCLVDGAAEECTVTTNSTFTTITIASNSSYNLYPQSSAVSIVINNLDFLYSSSHTQHIYHFYFQLTVSQAVSADKKTMLMVPMVIPERDELGSFGNYFSNDLNNTGSNFPNVFRLVSTDNTQWQNTIQADEKRIISVFAYQGWTNFFTSLSNGDEYPAKSNIGGFTYTYYKGTTNSLNEEYPLDWDRIDVILDGSEETDDFSIIFPTTFTTATPLLFEIMVGIYNVDTRQISYLQIQPQPIMGNPTYRSAANIAITSKPEVLTNEILLQGEAGSYMNNISVSITPGSGSYSALTYAAALMILSDWELFDENSAFSSDTLLSADPLFRNDEQTPLSIALEEYSSYLTYIPLGTVGTYSSQFTFYLDNIKLPYNHDLPYYSIYLIDGTGTIDCYNQFINENKNAFYQSYLQNLTFTCNDNSLGVTNTFCTMQFVPNHDIQVGSVVKLFFTGMQISTDLCQATQMPSTAVPCACVSNTDKNQLTITLNNENRLTNAGTIYSFVMYGVSIMSNTIIHYVTVQLRDPSASYVVETDTRILITSVRKSTPVSIEELKYSKNNPIVISSFTIKFQLPRQLNNDESFAIVMSKDLSNLNTIQSKLSVDLFDDSGVHIPAVWELNLKNYQIIFEGLRSTLTNANYTIQIHGLKTPSTIDTDLISLIYLRAYDNSYTITNDDSSTAVFPELVDKVDSFITLDPYFNTEGLEQQLTFTIVNQHEPVTEDTVWIVNLPQYYSENVWNEDFLIYCTIESIKLNCERDSKTPYQLVITHSPRVVEIGETYTIKVMGIVCPRAAYLNGNADYVTESIFMGISTNSTSQSYVQYSELFITDTIINPQNHAGYGVVTLTNVTSSNMEVRQTTFLQLAMVCSIDINDGQWLFITFPEQFDNFNDLSLTVEVEQSGTDETFSSEVINRRVGFQLSGMSLTHDVEFDVKLSSLLTPTTPTTIDMNKLRVMVVSSDLLGTTAASSQLHNLVWDITFQPSSLHIVINNYEKIEVTAGTYCSPIKIQPSDFGTFLSNMKISFTSDALNFKDSPTYTYLGEEYSQFTIGADQTIIPTIYTFDIVKTETSISAFYTSLNNYIVEVSNAPITIQLSSTVDVPLGGCSVPQPITLTNPPYSDLNINFQYDTSLYSLHMFWVNEEISYNQLEFNETVTERLLSFCCHASIGVSSMEVSAYLGGTNEDAYVLGNDSIISVNIVSNTSTNQQPTISLEEINVLKTYAGFDVTTNLNGQVYYEIKLSPLDSPLTISDLKSRVKEYNWIIEAQSDFMSHIYDDDRDHRVGVMSVVAGVHSLEFDNLIPQHEYTVCVHFENQHRTTSDRVCHEFKTQNWGSAIKATLTFTETIYNNELNNALCFFVKDAQSQINQIVDLEGQSCSLSSFPTNYNFYYSGVTYSFENSRTNIYFITNRNETTDPAANKFHDIYGTSNSSITDGSLSYAESSFSVNFIEASVVLESFSLITASEGSKSRWKPSLRISAPSFEQNKIKISSMELDQAGSVYFILVFNKRIMYNNITGHSDIQIKPAVKPSGEQITNCLDGEKNTPLDCRRVVLQKSEKYSDLQFSNISTDSVYILYYVVANEYPLRPILTSSVKTVTIDTSSQFWMVMSWAAIVLVGLIF